MRALIRNIILPVSFCLMTFAAIGQCANDNAGIGTLSPSGAGYSQSVIINGGSYVSVNVCVGATYVFSTCGDTSFDSQITVYNQSTGAQLAYNDDACGLQSSITWTSTFTGTVNVVLDMYYCSYTTAYINLKIQQTTSCSSGTLTNDACSNATPIACGQTISGNTNLATADTYATGCGYGTAYGVWYTFTGNGQSTTLSLCNSAYDTQISVFTGTCGSFSCVTTNDDFCGVQSQVTFNTVSGIVYSVLVFGYGGSTGAFALTLGCTNVSTSNQNCTTALPICTDTQFGGNSSGMGSTQDLNSTNQGCLSIEHQSSWYIFQPTTAGTISFTINPTPATDYDFAIWGPLVQPACPVSGTPLRCSYSALSAPTGLGNGATDLTEGAGGNAWVAPITVTPADVNKYYIMVLDNFSSTSTPFVFNWALSGVVLNCNLVLPVEFIGLSGKNQSRFNVIEWQTLSETNNMRFDIERSYDILTFTTIGSVSGAGNSSGLRAYNFSDDTFEKPLSYYRIKQVDVNGNYAYSDIVSVSTGSGIIVYPNPSENFIVISDLQNSLTGGEIIRICDQLGRPIMETRWNPQQSGNMQLDISNILQGVYYILLFNNSPDAPFRTGLIVK